MKKLTWIGDIRAGLELSDSWRPLYYNDVTDNQRRIKFFTNTPLKLNRLVKMLQVIESRRPYLNVTVKAKMTPQYNEVCVYYKPKIQVKTC
jgi:hypothetical protein